MQSRPARETLETSQLLENEEERRGEESTESTVQYSTVRCKKRDGGKKGREGKKGRRGPGSVFYLDVGSTC